MGKGPGGKKKIGWRKKELYRAKEQEKSQYHHLTIPADVSYHLEDVTHIQGHKRDPRASKVEDTPLSP